MFLGNGWWKGGFEVEQERDETKEETVLLTTRVYCVLPAPELWLEHSGAGLPPAE